MESDSDIDLEISIEMINAKIKDYINNNNTDTKELITKYMELMNSKIIENNNKVNKIVIT